MADPRAVRAASAILLLNPSPPLLFMGEEFGAQTPFLFFCDFEKDLAAAVTAGRRNEFARFTRFSDPASRQGIPDPNEVTTFEVSRLDWDSVPQAPGQDWIQFYRTLLRLRCQQIVPLLSGGCAVTGHYEVRGRSGLLAEWKFPDAKLTLLANLGVDSLSEFVLPDSPVIYASEAVSEGELRQGRLPAWSVVWFLRS